MRLFRFCLVLLLAVLLPLRGGLAATMPCGSAAVASPAAHGHAGHEHGHEHEHEHEHEHAGHAHHDAGHQATSPDSEVDTQAFHGSCTFCAAHCCMTPLPMQAPTVAAPPLVAEAVFEERGAGVPSFIASGPERPPRNI